MNPKHIKEFDRIVKNIQQIYKNSEVFELIRNYKEKYGYENYYNTLDSFGCLIGYQFTVDIISNSEYYPCFKITPNNVLNCDVGEIRLTINPFSNLIDCYRFLAKEYIYKLMELQINNYQLEI